MLTNKRVLLVDDDAKLLRGLARHFSAAGFEVATAISGSEAIVMLGQEEFEAIVCDNQMAGLTGTRLLGNIRSQFPNLKRFMLSGDISKTHAWLVENEIGVCRLFHKPCDHNELTTAVAEAIM